MKYSYSLITVILMTFSLASFGQMSESKSNPEQTAGIKQATKVSQKPHTVSYPSVENKDEYMGKKDLILERLIADEIPASLLKYKKGQPAEEYILQLKSWAKSHQELLKEKYRKK